MTTFQIKVVEREVQEYYEKGDTQKEQDKSELDDGQKEVETSSSEHATECTVVPPVCQADPN